MKKLAALSLGLLALSACQPAPEEKAPADAVSSSPEAAGLTLGDLSFSDYAVRAALGNVPNTAAYVSITNNGKVEERLISAACDCAMEAQTHTMKMENGEMQMAEAKSGFIIKPGETLVLKPGSNHIMLMGLKTRPQADTTQDVTLTFEHAGSITIPMPVSMSPLADKAAAMNMTSGMSGMGHP